MCNFAELNVASSSINYGEYLFTRRREPSVQHTIETPETLCRPWRSLHSKPVVLPYG